MFPVDIRSGCFAAQAYEMLRQILRYVEANGWQVYVHA